MRAAAVVILALLMPAIVPASEEGATRWEGVDKSVVEKYATAAGRPPARPFIDTDQGDLLLFLFLLAGGAGGFAGGYFFRELFPQKGREEKAVEERSAP